jgi:MerR family transcriptional regulator, copper efflux regulator
MEQVAHLTRGDVAEAARVNIETLRYYERRGVIPPPNRSEANYRKYPADTVSRVRFIKHAQDLGFTLDEIRDLLALRATRGARSAQVRSKAAAKIADIDTRIAALQRMRAALGHLVEECSGEGPASGCTILHAIERGGFRHARQTSDTEEGK